MLKRSDRFFLLADVFETNPSLQLGSRGSFSPLPASFPGVFGFLLAEEKIPR